MSAPAFDDAFVTLFQGFIQRSPPGHLADVISLCRQLATPAQLPKDLVWRAAAAHNERNLLILQPSTANAASRSSQDLLVVHEGLRAGSRAQQQVPYQNPKTDGDEMFAVDHEKQECTRQWVKQQSNDLMAELEDVDETIALPFREALEEELQRYLAERYSGPGGTSTGAAAFFVQSGKGEDVGRDVELTIVISARRARPRGLWAGAWGSQWRTVFLPGQAEKVKLVGIIEFTGHYAEDGNVHFKRTAKPRLVVRETTDPKRFAREVVEAIQREEDKFHEDTEDHCDTVCDGALKSLRRVLPVSKERFDWRPLRHALVRDMKAVGKEGGG